MIKLFIRCVELFSIVFNLMMKFCEKKKSAGKAEKEKEKSAFDDMRFDLNVLGHLIKLVSLVNLFLELF